MSNADIVTKKNSRKGFRGYVTQQSKAIDTLIADFVQRQQAAEAAPSTSNAADDDFTKTVELVLTSLKQIEARWASEDAVNCEIISLITDEDRLLEELAEQENHKDERVVITDKVARFVHRGSTTVPTVQVTLPSTVFVNRHNTVPATSTYREPTLKPFHGDIYDWPSWWELYEANVHSLNIPTRIKFAELERYIQGEAAKVIEGVSRTEAHYATAIQLLQEAYGDNKHRVEKLIDDLIDLPVVRDQSNVKALRGLLDGIKINVRMLANLGRPQASYSQDLLRRLVAKMPRDFAVAWNESPAADSGNIDDLVKFLEVKVKSRERCESSHKPTKEVQFKPEVRPARASGATVATLVNVVNTAKPSRNPVCQFCKGEHRAVRCHLSIEQRYEAANRDRRCHNCLAIGHRVQACHPQHSNCRNCGARHNTALCRRRERDGPGGERAPAAQLKPNDQPPPATFKQNVINCVTYSIPPENVLLQTATVKIGEESDQIYMCLLDLGSQRTLVRQEVAERLNLPIMDKEYACFTGLGNQRGSYAWRNRRELKIRGPYPNAEIIRIEAVEKDVITRATSSRPIPFSSYLQGQGLHLADHRFEAPGKEDEEVDILIGADLYWLIVGEGKVSGGNGLVAVASKLGWILSGPVFQQFCGNPVRIASMMVRVSHAKADGEEDSESGNTPNGSELQEAIADLTAFFELEHFGIRDEEPEQHATPLSDRIMPHIMQQPSGRYLVPLPWNEKKSRLASNRKLAESRLRGLLRRLDQDRRLLVEYHQQLMEFVRLGWMQEVNPNESSGVDNYLPHLPVIRPEKTSSKLRIVFDASAKGPGGCALTTVWKWETISILTC